MNSNSKGFKKGFDKEIFKKAIKIASGTNNSVPVQIFDAIVQAGSQNSDSMTCFVDSVDSTINNLEVRYMLCIDDGELNVPADNSLVTIAKTAFTDPYIVKSTSLNSKFVSIGNQSYSNDGTIQDFEFYGEVEGSFGGFIKDIDPEDPEKGLLKKINNLENDLNTLKSDFSSLLIIANTLSIALTALGGSPIPGSTLLPFITSLITEFTPYSTNVIIPTISSDLENPNIIHGLKKLPT